MQKPYTTVDYAAFAIVGTVAFISLLYVLFGWKAIGSTLWDQTAAGWAQAFGSVGAIAGAAWLARNDQRMRRADATLGADLMLTRVKLTLVHAITAITPVVNELSEGPQSQTAEAFDRWRMLLASVNEPTQAELQVLWPLHRSFSHGLIEAFTTFAMAKVVFAHTIPLGPALGVQHVVPQWQVLFSTARRARNTLIISFRQVERALGAADPIGDGIALTPEHPAENAEPPDMQVAD